MSTPGTEVVPAGKLIHRMAEQFGIDEGKLTAALKATAFKVKDGVASDAQLLALMVVADQYGLNPFTRELFAFPDKNNGIVPVVSVDGWARIINDNPAMNGVEFEYGPPEGDHHAWIDCIISRKDREKPIRVREFFKEVSRGTGPWQSHPNRMHRHKVLIQCARIAFGFGGIYDEDEADRILDGQFSVVPNASDGGPKLAAAREAIQAGTEGHEPDKRASVIADLGAKADEGRAALQQCWEAMSEEERALVGPAEFDRIKKLAKGE